MKFKSLQSNLKTCLLGIAMLAFGAAFTACSDDDTVPTATEPFNPAQEVTITGFTPESGGYQEQIIVKGSNFGVDKNFVTLKIGGKQAVIVSVMSDKLYAYVPSGAFSGEVEITVTDELGNSRSAVSEKKFEYLRKKVVGTLVGYQNENDTQGEVWGSFDEAAGFNAEGTLAFDPLYPNRLYVTYDRSEGFIGQLDLEKRESTRLMSANKFQSQRLRQIAFTNDGQYMLVASDRADRNYDSPSLWIVKRNSDGTFSDASNTQQLALYKQCNTVAIHPVNGEVYFNSYENGQLFRLDLNDYFKTFEPSEDPDEETEPWKGTFESGAFRELYRIMDPSYEFQIVIHPSGDYAYITVINRSFILRTDYDWKKKEFTTPYTVAGANGAEDWVDAVGTSARLHRPYQGVFVKNPEYEAEGRADVYDYYFADVLNFCVRRITPDGLVRTYAGRAPSTNGNIWGTEDGDLRSVARFRDVTGIAYDEGRDMFYVLDHNNRRIRTIGEESEDQTITPPAEEDTPSTDEPNE